MSKHSQIQGEHKRLALLHLQAKGVFTSSLAELGAETLHYSLEDLEAPATGAGASDRAMHMAFGGDFSDPAGMTQRAP